MKEYYDVIIIGSGIAGMTAAIYLKRSGIDTLIIEENAPGGQLNKINSIENYPGFIKTDGPTLAAELFSQVRNLDIDYLFDRVVNTDLTGNDKKIETEEMTIHCKYVIIATGRTTRKLFDNDERYVGKGISYCALCDGNLYKNKNVIVVGGGNSALEEALYLSNICKKVVVLIRGDKFKGEQTLINQVKNKKNINCMYNSNISEYNIKNNKLVSIKLDNGNKLDTDGLFISIGSVPSAKIFDVEKEKGFIIVDNNCMTNIKNVYAIGDVIKKKVYQLTTATADGTIAAYSIIQKNKK